VRRVADLPSCSNVLDGKKAPILLPGHRIGSMCRARASRPAVSHWRGQKELVHVAVVDMRVVRGQRQVGIEPLPPQSRARARADVEIGSDMLMSISSSPGDQLTALTARVASVVEPVADAVPFEQLVHEGQQLDHVSCTAVRTHAVRLPALDVAALRRLRTTLASRAVRLSIFRRAPVLRPSGMRRARSTASLVDIQPRTARRCPRCHPEPCHAPSLPLFCAKREVAAHRGHNTTTETRPKLTARRRARNPLESGRPILDHSTASTGQRGSVSSSRS